MLEQDSDSEDEDYEELYSTEEVQEAETYMAQGGDTAEASGLPAQTGQGSGLPAQTGQGWMDQEDSDDEDFDNDVESKTFSKKYQNLKENN